MQFRVQLAFGISNAYLKIMASLSFLRGQPMFMALGNSYIESFLGQSSLPLLARNYHCTAEASQFDPLFTSMTFPLH
jgi:hypothetical protein